MSGVAAELAKGRAQHQKNIDESLAAIQKATGETWTFECLPSDHEVAEAAAAASEHGKIAWFYNTIKVFLDEVRGDIEYLDPTLRAALVAAAPTRVVAFSIDESDMDGILKAKLVDEKLVYSVCASKFNNSHSFNRRLGDVLQSDPAVALAKGRAQHQKNIDECLAAIQKATGETWTFECLPSDRAVAEAAAAASEHGKIAWFYNTIKVFLDEVRGDIEYLDPTLRAALVAAAPTRVVAFSIDESDMDGVLKAKLVDERLVYSVCASNFNNSHSFNRRLGDILQSDPAVALARGERDPDFIRRRDELLARLRDFDGFSWTYEVAPSASAVAKRAAEANPDIQVRHFNETIIEFLMSAVDDITNRVGDTFNAPKECADALKELASKHTIVFRIDEENTSRSIKASIEDGKIVYGICAKNFTSSGHFAEPSLIDAVIAASPGAKAAYEAANGSAGASDFNHHAHFQTEKKPKPCTLCKSSPIPGKRPCSTCKGVVGKCGKGQNCKGKGWTGNCMRCQGKGFISVEEQERMIVNPNSS